MTGVPVSEICVLLQCLIVTAIVICHRLTYIIHAARCLIICRSRRELQQSIELLWAPLVPVWWDAPFGVRWGSVVLWRSSNMLWQTVRVSCNMHDLAGHKHPLATAWDMWVLEATVQNIVQCRFCMKSKETSKSFTDIVTTQKQNTVTMFWLMSWLLSFMCGLTV